MTSFSAENSVKIEISCQQKMQYNDVRKF